MSVGFAHSGNRNGWRILPHMASLTLTGSKPFMNRSVQNILSVYAQATFNEREAGADWYADAHKAIRKLHPALRTPSDNLGSLASSSWSDKMKCRNCGCQFNREKRYKGFY